MTSYLSENEAENLQNGDIHLAQLPDYEWNISRIIGALRSVMARVFFFNFHALSFEPDFFRPEFPFKASYVKLICIELSQLYPILLNLLFITEKKTVKFCFDVCHLLPVCFLIIQADTSKVKSDFTKTMVTM